MKYTHLVFLLFCIGVVWSTPVTAKRSMFYVNQVYDYPQSKLKEIIENYDKGAFCAPAAASNILKTFHANQAHQGQMIKLLASKEYMDTDPGKGTTTHNFMKGLAKYMEDHLRGYKDIQYQGLGHYPEFHTGVGVPDLGWITDGLGIKKGTWLGVTMFKHDSEKDQYNSVSGHLVTLVGYDLGYRKDILVVHDSAAPADAKANNEYLGVEPIESGELVFGEAAIPAKGFLKVVDGQNVRYGGGDYDTIIITGVVRLEKK